MKAPRRIAHPGIFNGYRVVAPLVHVRLLDGSATLLHKDAAVSAESVSTAELDRLVDGGFLQPLDSGTAA